VQPFLLEDELYEHLGDVYKSRSFPDIESQWYQAPGGDYEESLYADGYPATKPDVVARHIFDEDGADLAILNPRTRGNLPDHRLNSAICAATNAWLADRWLERGDSRFRGTIRVNPEDVSGAVAQIEEWSGHPQMVQIGVPLQSRDLYGRPRFYPIWAAAAERGLPICVSTNGGAGVEYPPTATGHPRTYAHYLAFSAYTFFYHLANILSEPLLQEVPDAVFVFSDGGADILTPFIWKLDTLWLSMRDQTPWVERKPSEYLLDHVRVGFSRIDGDRGAVPDRDWLAQTGKDDLIMYASNYPFWWRSRPGDLPDGLTEEQTEKLLWRNAEKLYALGAGAATR
jgi:predicted TIM-barrel fold metal-dependent hydrolase